MNLDQSVNLDDAATIRLAGKSYYIPTLPLRQSIKLFGMLPVINALHDKFASDPSSVTENELTSIAEVILIGLQKAYPDSTLDTVLDMQITIDELLPAVKTIADQTRAVRKAPSGEA